MKKTQAVKLFKSGWGCSQSVFSVFCEEYGISKENAFKISDAFTGGMGRTGKTCGALTAGLMVIGLYFDRGKSSDYETKKKVQECVRDYFARFNALYGSLECSELLEKRKACALGVNEATGKQKSCSDFVESSVSILESLISNVRENTVENIKI